MKKGFKFNKETIKSCDESCKEMQNLLIEVTKITSPKIVWLIWVLTRFYKRTITDEAVSYDFYLFSDGKKNIKNKS